MRLLSRVDRLAAARSAAAVEGAAIGVVWTREDERLPEGTELRKGEHIAVDYYELAPAAAVEPGGELPPMRRAVERVSKDAADLGYLYDAAGNRVGRVVDVSKSGVYRVEMWAEPQRGQASGATKP